MRSDKVFQEIEQPYSSVSKHVNPSLRRCPETSAAIDDRVPCSELAYIRGVAGSIGTLNRRFLIVQITGHLAGFPPGRSAPQYSAVAQVALLCSTPFDRQPVGVTVARARPSRDAFSGPQVTRMRRIRAEFLQFPMDFSEYRRAPTCVTFFTGRIAGRARSHSATSSAFPESGA